MCLFGATRAVFEAAKRSLRLLILPSLLGLWFSGLAGAQSVAQTGATGEVRFAAAVALYPYCPGNNTRRYAAISRPSWCSPGPRTT